MTSGNHHVATEGTSRRAVALRDGGYRKPILVVFASLVTVTIVLTVALPASAFCAAAKLVPLERLPDGSFYERSLSHNDQQHALDAHKDAVGRITQVFGYPAGQPVIIHLAHPEKFWPLPFNAYAITSFFGTRSCIVTGPDGRNVDVLAHELVHAELFARVGYWRRLTQIPTWFDEGSGMQVDYRSDFDLDRQQSPADTSSVRAKTSFHKFFAVQPEVLTQHFAYAKAQVAAWLKRGGNKKFYTRLHEVKAGMDFDKIWEE